MAIKQYTLAELLSCTGGANATVFDSSGNLVVQPAPALDFDPITKAARGLAFRGAGAANLLGNGDTEAWNANTPNTALPGAIIGRTGCRVIPGSVAGDAPSKTVSPGLDIAAGTLICVSVHVDLATVDGGSNVLQLMGYAAVGGTANNFRQNFTLTNPPTLAAFGVSGTAFLAADVQGGMELVSGTVFRLWASATLQAASAAAQTKRVYLSGAPLTVVAGAVQFETGVRRPRPYVPTTNGFLSRGADQAGIADLQTHPWWNNDEGTFLVDFDIASIPEGGGDAAVLSLANAANTNYLILAIKPLTGTLGIWSNGVAYRQVSAGALQPNQPYRLALAWKRGAPSIAALDGAAAVAGATPWTGPDTAAQMALRLGTWAVNPGPMNGHIRSLRYWPKAANADELPNLSPQTAVING